MAVTKCNISKINPKVNPMVRRPGMSFISSILNTVHHAVALASVYWYNTQSMYSFITKLTTGTGPLSSFYEVCQSFVVDLQCWLIIYFVIDVFFFLKCTNHSTALKIQVERNHQCFCIVLWLYVGVHRETCDGVWSCVIIPSFSLPLAISPSFMLLTHHLTAHLYLATYLVSYRKCIVE